MMNSRGFTLVELLVAMIAGGLVIISAFTFLRVMQVQSIKTDRASRFAAEFSSSLKSLQNELRTSPAILSWDYASIVFIDLPYGDTVTLRSTTSGLFRNDTLLPLVCEGAAFDCFRVVEQPLNRSGGRQRMRLIDIHVEAHGMGGLRRDGMMRVALPFP